MNIENVKKTIEQSPNMATNLGIEFLSTPEADTCAATMAVDGRTCQPYGILNGGASLALAENLAGVGSKSLCPDCQCMGINVNGQHLKAVKTGHTIHALATILHRGHTLHVWRVDLTDEIGDLVSTINVTNFLLASK